MGRACKPKNLIWRTGVILVYLRHSNLSLRSFGCKSLTIRQIPISYADPAFRVRIGHQSMVLLRAAFIYGGAFFQHWLGYYLYPGMRRIALFMTEEVTRE